MKAICKLVMGILFLFFSACNPFAPVYDDEQACREAVLIATLIFINPDNNDGDTEKKKAGEERFKTEAIIMTILNCNSE